MGLVELGKLLERKFTSDVGIEDKEGRVVLGQDLFGQLQGASSTEGLVLDGEDDIDTKFIGVLKAMVLMASAGERGKVRWFRY